MTELDYYPQKPELTESQKRNNWAVTFFSIVLFVLIFSFFFESKMNVILFLVGVLFLHELGHFLGMKFFGYKNVRMLFVPILGAFVHGKKDVYSQKESLIVLFLGPFPGVILGCLCIWLSPIIGWTDLFILGFLFLLLNVLNLLPIDPLDGGQMLKHLMKGNSELFLLVFSFISSLAMIGIGLFMHSTVLIVFGFAMGIRVRSIQKKRNIHKEITSEGVNFVQVYRELSNKDYAIIKNIIIQRSPALEKYMEMAEQEELDELFAHQVNNVLEPPLKKDGNIFFLFLVVLFWIFSLLSPFLMYYLSDLNWMRYVLSSW